MFKLIRKLNKKDCLYAFICLIFVSIQVWLDLKLPDYMTNITNLLTTSGLVKDILEQGFYMLLCAFFSLVSAFITGYFASYLSASFSKRLRSDVYDKIMDFNMEEIKSFSTSSLITRTTNDVAQVQMFLSMGLQVMIKAPILAVWAILKILGKGWQWSLITFGAVILLFITILIVVLFALPKFKIIQKLTDNLNRITRESLTGIRVIRAFNADDYQEEKFEKANDELSKTHLFTGRIMSIMNPVMSLVMSGLSLAIYFVGAILINNADISIKFDLFSNMVVFVSYAMQVVMAFMMLTMIFIIYPRASVSADRILEVLNCNPKVKDGKFDGETKLKGVLEFKNVSFKYPDADEYVIKNVSFKVKSGETIAFVGLTGSGKSTLINLIPRFYDVTDGEILIDGVNVKDYKLECLYNKIGYAPQKASLFSGTIKSNIAFGEGNVIFDNNITIEAIRVAQGEEFVEALPNKYDSRVAQGGSNFSGGQKQRLSIARAIARNPEIFIFDDSFSALDYKTDLNLRKALNEYTSNSTCVIVAQRIGTIMNADKIVVIDNGEVKMIGNHKELLKKCDIYREIAYSQLSKEELENA